MKRDNNKFNIKKGLKYTIIIVIIIISLLLLYLFTGFLQLIYGVSNTKVRLDLGKYSVVQHSQYNTSIAGAINICEKESNKCTYGYIKGLNKNTDNNIIYFYSILDRPWYYTEESEKINYGLGEVMINYIATENDIQIYFIIKNGEFNVYSKDMFQELTIEEQKIFKDLEDNPRIIIDGIEQDWKN